MQEVKFYNGKLYIETDNIWDDSKDYWGIFNYLVVEYEGVFFNEDEIEDIVEQVTGEEFYESLIESLPNAKFWRPLNIKELL